MVPLPVYSHNMAAQNANSRNLHLHRIPRLHGSHASRGTGGYDIARLQGHRRSNKGDNLPHIGNKQLRVALLHYPAVQTGGDGQVVRIHLIGDQRPQRGKPIHVFPRAHWPSPF